MPSPVQWGTAAGNEREPMQHALFCSLVAMCSLFAASTWCLARPHALSSLAAAVAAALWFLMNGMLEGRVLYSVTPDHGLTEADLLSGVALAISAWGFRTTARNRRRRERRPRPAPRSVDVDETRAMPQQILAAQQDVSVPPRGLRNRH
ncbi:hypothetical protein [Rhodococcus sp. BL-253-APC-6A1W]|uniref:hypothetical protein n=1 Tax=Rhodococcus sp. BL-253-APC-6A1W TaxID=2725307 RepID=UPI001F0ECCCB|nr:hypothetical protein [Rhodococcus sp. BL-253-APC-6A1W]